LVRGSGRDDDLLASGDYLDVNVDARRVIVFLSHPNTSMMSLSTDMDTASHLSQTLGVEVLSTRGNEETILLVEARDEYDDSAYVRAVKKAVQRLLPSLGREACHAGVSS